MKLRVIGILVIVSLISCFSDDKPLNSQTKIKKNDLLKLNLNGKVKSVRDFLFEFEKSDSTFKVKRRKSEPSYSTSEGSDSKILFDSIGNEIARYAYGHYDTLDSKILYQYGDMVTMKHDKEGNLIQENFFSLGGVPTLQRISSYKYDCMNNMVEQIDRNYGPEFNKTPGFWSSKVKREWIRTYDKAGYETENFYYENEGKGFKTDYRYDSLGNLVEVYNSNNPFSEKQIYKYDIKRNIIEKKRHAFNGMLTSNETFEYDDKNNLLKDRRQIYKYEYDNKGNWIKKNIFPRDLTPYFIIRVIEYYE